MLGRWFVDVNGVEECMDTLVVRFTKMKDNPCLSPYLFVIDNRFEFPLFAPLACTSQPLNIHMSCRLW